MFIPVNLLLLDLFIKEVQVSDKLNILQIYFHIPRGFENQKVLLDAYYLEVSCSGSHIVYNKSFVFLLNVA